MAVAGWFCPRIPEGLGRRREEGRVKEGANSQGAWFLEDSWVRLCWTWEQNCRFQCKRNIRFRVGFVCRCLAYYCKNVCFGTRKSGTKFRVVAYIYLNVRFHPEPKFCMLRNYSSLLTY